LKELALLGIPWDHHSSFLRGAALAPPLIREALFNGASNLCTGEGGDLHRALSRGDLGDLVLDDPSEARRAIEARVAELMGQGRRLLCLGGDHAITYPIIRATAPHYPELTLLQLDAHPDLYDSYDQDRFSHACGFARIMEEGLVDRLVQVGIRAANGHQREQAKRFGVEMHEMVNGAVGGLRLDGPVYLSIDLDVLDPAFAPGVSHQEPGGMSTREVLDLIRHLAGEVVGADLVEYNPRRDPAGITAAVAAKLVKETWGRMQSA